MGERRGAGGIPQSGHANVLVRKPLTHLLLLSDLELQGKKPGVCFYYSARTALKRKGVCLYHTSDIALNIVIAIAKNH